MDLDEGGDENTTFADEDEIGDGIEELSGPSEERVQWGNKLDWATFGDFHTLLSAMAVELFWCRSFRVPLYTLELGLGQIFQLGPIKVMSSIHPRLAGIGVTAVTCTFLVSLYYNVIISWTLFYLGNSVLSPLPWSDERGGAENFWYNTTLHLTDNINDIGGLNWRLFICLTVAWAAVYICIFKGVKSIGKVIYVAALLPYVVLIIFFFRGVTLPGAWDGIKFFILPNWERLKDLQVWSAASIQIFYSLGCGFGGTLSLASYNPRKNYFVRDGIIVSLINSGTSIFGGIVVFATIGYMANLKGVDISELNIKDSGLAFIVYPENIAHFPAPQFFAIAFFIMLFLLGVDSQFCMIEVVSTVLWDFGRLRDFFKGKKWLMVALVCVIGWILGFVFVTNGGLYVVDILDQYVSSFALFLVCLVECIGICWIYGHKNFADEVKAHVKRPIPKLFLFAWKWTCPPLLLFLMVMAIVILATSDLGALGCREGLVPGGSCGADVQWTVGFGFFLAVFPLLGTLVFLIKNWKKKKVSDKYVAMQGTLPLSLLEDPPDRDEFGGSQLDVTDAENSAQQQPSAREETAGQE